MNSCYFKLIHVSILLFHHKKNIHKTRVGTVKLYCFFSIKHKTIFSEIEDY